MDKLIVANWKMYLTLRQSVALAKRLTAYSLQLTAVSRQPLAVSIVVCPSFVALEEVAKVVRPVRARGRLRRPTSNGIKLGAQDVWPEARGAFTGEVGLDDLHELGVEYVLVGHSERRQSQGEKDKLVNKKLLAVLKSGMRPILCVGEPWRSKGEKWAKWYVAKQLRVGLKGVLRQDLKRVIIAYEPIWAIGTGRPASPQDASMMHEFIRETLSKLSFRVLYGGSVNGENAAAFLKAPSVDGLLVGGASTRAEEFLKILKSC